jgi:hypothetical protein
MKKLLAVLFTLLLLPVASLAKYVAVLETISDKDLLTLQERQYLTDILRGQAVKVLPAEQNWTIMTRENINVMLPPGKSIEDCEGSCLAETGKNIAADFVAQARISKFGNSLAISAELYETAGNKLVASFAGRGESVDDLEKIIKEQAAPFFKKVRGDSWAGASGFGDFGSSGSFSFAGSQKFIVEIETTPKGAIPTVDGKAIPKCTSTPCKVQLEAGEHRLVVSRERFDDLDTLVNITSNNQKIDLVMIPNVGYVVFSPAMSDAWKQKYPLSVTIDGEKAKSGKNELLPGVHSVQMSHPCYDPVEFKVAVQKGKTETFADSLKPGVGGIELDVEKNGEPVIVPVYVDGKDVGSTPFAGEVPVCAQITVGDDRQMVPVELKWHEVVKTSYTLRETAFVPVEETRAKAETAYAELEGKDTVVKAAPASEPASEPAEEPAPQKRFWGGVFAGATYNDFYGTKFGLNNIGSSDEYSLKVDGADDLLGNYWGIGVNAGFSGLFLFSQYVGLRADVGVAFRKGKGKSDVTVKLFWNDETRSPEKSDLEIEYSEKQLNIDVPVLLRVMVPDVMYVEAGPMASFNLYSKSKSDISDIYGSQEFEDEGDMNLFEFDVAFGLGTMRPVGKSMLDFNLRFVLGITPLNDSDDSPKTWQGQFNVTYWFL